MENILSHLERSGEPQGAELAVAAEVEMERRCWLRFWLGLVVFLSKGHSELDSTDEEKSRRACWGSITVTATAVRETITFLMLKPQGPHVELDILPWLQPT